MVSDEDVRSAATPPGGVGPRVWFLGDLDDSWVVGLAEALPPPWPTRRVHCPADLPDDPFGPLGPPDVIVLHRAVLTAHDADRLLRWRSAGATTPRVILCHGPHARAADLDRWAGLVDLALPEATARESIGRQLGVPGPRDRRAEPAAARRARPRVAVVSGQFELRRMLAEAVAAAGYPVAEARDWSEAPPDAPAVWDVPVLEPGWADEMSRRTRWAPVLALIGFADRELVRLARERGATACLDLPFDLADLADGLERMTAPRPRSEPGHAAPPPPLGRRNGTAARLAEPERRA